MMEGTATITVKYKCQSGTIATATRNVNIGCDPSKRLPSSEDNVISDAKFTDSTALTEAQIKAILTNRATSPDNLGNQTQNFDMDGDGKVDNTPFVDAVAQVIANASVTHNISPWIILTTLQKEQSLIAGKNQCTADYRYNNAMGIQPLRPDCSTFTFPVVTRDHDRFSQLSADIRAGASFWRAHFDGAQQGNYLPPGGGSIPWTVAKCHPLFINGNLAELFVKPINAATATIWIYTPDCNSLTDCPGGRDFRNGWSAIGGPTLP